MTMTIKAALTAEEWAVAHDYWGVPSVILGQVGSTLANGAFVSEGNRHALAALCLHEQPFGFWPQLPFSLRSAAEHLRVLTKEPNGWTDLDLAADIIQALLPPEDAS